ncbi:MAG: Tim44/TimA family putative adaptor protein [Pseudomonadota bacterium]
MDPFTLFFAGVALFLIYKLIATLGTRTGHEQSHDIEGLQRARHTDADASAAGESEDGYDDARQEPAESREPAPVSPAAAPLRAVDPQFDEAEFLEGAKAAYEMIVGAFADGDLAPVKSFLAPAVYDAFKGVVDAREQSGARFEFKFVGVDSAEITDASADSAALTATVAFASNQVRTHYDKDGVVTEGDPTRIDLVRDTWTFSRPVRSSNPNWTLAATGG